MEHQVSDLSIEAKTSLSKTNTKKIWHKPKVIHLNLQDTNGGARPKKMENPQFNIHIPSS